MANLVSGSVAVVANSANYTPGAGSNRVVLAFAFSRQSPAVNLTNITYNSITKTPIISSIDTSTGDRDSFAVCIWKEADLPTGAVAMTRTWAAAVSDERILMMTIENVDQTTTNRTPVSNIGPANPMEIVHSGLTVGDFVIGGLAQRGSSVGTLGNSFISIESSSNSDGGRWEAAYKTVGATSETLSYTIGGSDDFAGALIALINVSGGPATITGTGAITNTSTLLNGVGVTNGHSFTTIATPLAPYNERLVTSPDLANGDIIEYWLYGGTGSLTVNTNGSIIADTTVTHMMWKVFDGVDWSQDYIYEFMPGKIKPATNIRIASMTSSGSGTVT